MTKPASGVDTVRNRQSQIWPLVSCSTSSPFPAPQAVQGREGREAANDRQGSAGKSASPLPLKWHDRDVDILCSGQNVPTGIRCSCPEFALKNITNCFFLLPFVTSVCPPLLVFSGIISQMSQISVSVSPAGRSQRTTGCKAMEINAVCKLLSTVTWHKVNGTSLSSPSPRSRS